MIPCVKPKTAIQADYQIGAMEDYRFDAPPSVREQTLFFGYLVAKTHDRLFSARSVQNIWCALLGLSVAFRSPCTALAARCLDYIYTRCQ